MKTVVAALSCVLFAMVVTAADARSDQDLKAAAKSVTETFEGTSFTAKTDLRRYGHHFVTPSGEPHPGKGKKQGRGGEGSIQLDSGVKVRAGEIGYTIAVGAKGKDQVYVAFNKKPKAYMNPAVVHILYDRPVTVDDLTPEKIALAVQSLVVIKGYEPGTQVAAAFDEVLASGSEPPPGSSTAPAAPAAANPSAPTATSVAVRVEPSPAKAGGEVSLVLEYAVAAPSGPVTSTETRSLSLDGRMVPNYPLSEEISRERGAFISRYRQPLPRTVTPGTYLFKGEVCVAGDCISRSVSFEVTP